MKKNMGAIDRGIRTLIAVAVAVLYATGQISGLAAGILGALAIIFVLTSAAGYCPLYAPFGWSTRRRSGAAEA